MKYFVLFTIFLVSCYCLGFIKKPEKYQWMDMNYTIALKGFSILLIVWAHTGAKLSVGGIQFIAGIGVALFLICSGYGLEVSYKKNGLNGFWKKRIIGVCIPFWLVELVGLSVTNNFSIKTYLLDSIFIKSATGYGWFMGYIIICYLVFYLAKRFVSDDKIQMKIIFITFVSWFIMDSFFFANPDMPFLRARQMLSFPAGILLASNKAYIEEKITKIRSVIILTGGGTLCIAFMAITQLSSVKELPYIFSNILSLFTCFPMAIGILQFGKYYSGIFENRILTFMGNVSFEIYLVHVFLLKTIQPSIASIILFVFSTCLLSWILHMAIGKTKYKLLK